MVPIIASAEDVLAAANRMINRLKAAEPDAAVLGFLTQKMVSGLEMIAGLRDDPQFGTVMTLGFGGVLVEAIGDVSFRLLPVTEADVRDMLDELDAKALLGDFRGAPARDVEALVRAVVGLSDAYPILRGRYSDIEINPIMLGAAGEGVYAVDIRAIARDDG